MALGTRGWNVKAKRKNATIGGASATLILVLGTWWVSRSHAESRAGELLSATADMVRCVGGDPVEMNIKSLERAYHRRLVTSLPDIVPVSDCPQALETVKDKLAAYEAVWFSSSGAKGQDGQPLGTRIRAAFESLSASPYDIPANKALLRREQDAPAWKLPALSMDLYNAVQELMNAEGADSGQVAAAAEKRMRTTRKVPDAAPKASPVASLQGHVAPDHWGISPSSQNAAHVYALSDKGQALVATTENAGGKWESASGTIGGSSYLDADFRTVFAPNSERWLVLAQQTGKKTQISAAKLVPGSKTLPTLVPVADPPANWSRLSGAERELVVVGTDTLAYPIRTVVKKTPKQKSEEEKKRKDWQKHLGDKEVQLALALDAMRAKARGEQGIDEDHQPVDGVAYYQLGKSAPSILELPGYGLVALVPGSEPTLVLGREAVPSPEILATRLPGPGETLGAMATAATDKPVQYAFGGTAKAPCVGADGGVYGLTDRGIQLMLLRPGAVEVTFLKVDVPEGTMIGCGQATGIVPLPFQSDRIFANVLTVRGGEVEGAKVATTSGTHVKEFNETVAAGLVQGAIMVAWVAEGYVQAVVSTNWGTEFGAPMLMAEATADGATVSGVKVMGAGSRLLLIVAKEKCGDKNSCATDFEALVSEDQGKTWRGA